MNTQQLIQHFIIPKVQGMCWKTFHNFSKSQFPYVKRLSKRTDFCDLCCKRKEILNDPKKSIDEKDMSRLNLQAHLKLAEEARKSYSDTRKNFIKEDDKFLISFDFAENILLPIKIDEPSSFYFKTRRKVDLFGICNENTNSQLNFLIDEEFKIGKDGNAVISMLDFYLRQCVPPNSSLVLYCDNCPGQNKNPCKNQATF